MCETRFTRHACTHLSSHLTRCSLNISIPHRVPRDCPSPIGHTTICIRSPKACTRCKGIRTPVPLLGCDRDRIVGGIGVKIKCLGCEFLGKRCGDEWWVADLEECLGEEVVVQMTSPVKMVHDDSDDVEGPLKGQEENVKREAQIVQDLAGVMVWTEVEWTADRSASGDSGCTSGTGTPSTEEEDTAETQISPKTTTFRDWMKWGVESATLTS